MSDIELHISRLLEKPKSAILAKTSIKYLTTNIKRAIENKTFFSIDFEKYGDTIIQQSDLSDEEKEKIRYRFQHKEEEADVKPPPEKVPQFQRRVKIETKEPQGTNEVHESRPRRQSEVITKFEHLNIPFGAPMEPKKSQNDLPFKKDDSMTAAMAAGTSEKQDEVRGIPVVRNVRRNSMMSRRPPSQTFVFD